MVPMYERMHFALLSCNPGIPEGPHHSSARSPAGDYEAPNWAGRSVRSHHHGTHGSAKLLVLCGQGASLRL